MKVKEKSFMAAFMSERKKRDKLRSSATEKNTLVAYDTNPVRMNP